MSHYMDDKLETVVFIVVEIEDEEGDDSMNEWIINESICVRVRNNCLFIYHLVTICG